MSTVKFSSIQTLEPDSTTFPVTNSGSAYSSWFDSGGLTVFGVIYPFGITASYLTLQSKYTGIPTIGSIQWDYQTLPGDYMTWKVVAASKTDSTYMAATWQPSLSGGSRFLRIVSLDASLNPVTEASTRQFYILARKI